MNEEEIKKAMEEFGALIRERRQQKGWGARKLAEKAGMSHPSVLRLENGGNVSLENIVRIVDGLGCRLSVKWK